MNVTASVETLAMNALTVDVEEWFHISDSAVMRPLSFEKRVRGNIGRLLEALDVCKVTATFFVLGSLAESDPGIVGDITAHGHEIASHGYSHSLITNLNRDGFRDELRRTGDILERQSGSRPKGFRAPRWSLSRERTPWAFDVLLEEGYCYDSSCTPLRFIGDRNGSRTPWKMKLNKGWIWEIPPLVSPSIIGNLPTGGGWGFRFFPIRLIESTMRTLNAFGSPAVLFLHPRELDPSGPRLKMSPFMEFVAYGSRKDAMERLTRLLSSFRYTSLGKMVEQWEAA